MLKIYRENYCSYFLHDILFGNNILKIILTLFIFISCNKKEDLDNKPNIVFIIADDMNTAVSGFGHPQVKTPELDKLSQKGVKFNNMHCQYPVCGASRASILSGVYPYKNKTMGNSGTLRGNMPEVITMPQLFRNNGYHVGRISKIYHMNIPHDILSGKSGKDDPQSWDWFVNIKAPEQHTPGVKTNWSPKNTTSQSFIGIVGEADDLDYADGITTDYAIKFLKKNKDKPFFLAVGYVRPHVPLVAPKKYFDLYNQNEMEIPYVKENDLNDVPKIIRDYKSNISTYGITPELHKGLLEAYYSCISYVDAQVGQIIDTLEELDLRKNTIIVFSSDHGYLLGHHNKFQKQHLFEESTKVPFIISVPWLEDQHGNKTNKITELIDLYPTLAELSNLEPPSLLQGNSLYPLLIDPNSKSWEKEMAFTVSRNGGESIRTDKWRFTQWGFGELGYELYDIINDPGEFTNQAKNPNYKTVFDELKSKLEQKRLSIGYKEFIDSNPEKYY